VAERRPLRLLVLAESLHAGGRQLCQADVVACLAARGHVVDVLYCRGGPLLPVYEPLARTMRRVSAFHVVPRRPASAVQVVRTVSTGRGADYDVVYVSSYYDTFVAAAIARRGRIPVVCHLYQPAPQRQGAQLRLGMKRVARFIAGSAHTRDEFVARGVHAGQIDVVSGGIQTGLFAPATESARVRAREVLGLHSDSRVVLFAGRLDREKGVDLLLDAWADVARHSDAQLAIVGAPYHLDPEYAETIRRGAERVGASVAPWQSNMIDVYAAADIVAVPSRWADPSPRVPLEAMACGVPVVATAVGGIPEVLVGTFDDHLVPPEDATALGRALRRILGWRETDPSLGTRGREHVLLKFSLDGAVDGVEASLRRAIRESGSA
jgi:glycosyltransferase involved in cell wall biosynthesis